MTWHVAQAGPADMGVLSEVIAEAFHDLPPAWWLIADPGQRRYVLPSYFALLIEHALTAGIVYTTPARTAVALWLPVAAEGTGQPDDDYSARLAQVTGGYTARFVAFEAMLGQHHPTGDAHHHLAILAVRPDAQGQGIGTALLRTHHTALDATGTPAYLEASSERGRALYLRHGYTDSQPFCLPGGGPPMWPMWRPRTQTSPARPGSG